MHAPILGPILQGFFLLAWPHLPKKRVKVRERIVGLNADQALLERTLQEI